MSERKDFFAVTIDIELLESHALSKDSTLRWAAAIELGQVGTEEAVSLLWSLTTDSDENVRDAANLGLQQCDQVLVGKVLATKWVAPEVVSLDESDAVVKFIPWKVRPLEVPSSENEWAVDAAVLNIIQVEGPVNVSRVLRLYGNAAYPNNPRKIPKSRIQTAIKRLEKRNLIQHIIGSNNEDIETWTLYLAGTPEVKVREQGQRKLIEIPVTEVIARLRYNMGDDFDYASQNDRVKALMSIYGIKQSELHLLGAVMANEWSDLLAI
jgi:hypothetical protein